VIAMTKKTKDILRQIADQFCSMDPSDFERVIEEHKTGDIALALNALWADIDDKKNREIDR